MRDGDTILMATDGVFDNLPENMLLAELIKVSKQERHAACQNNRNSNNDNKMDFYLLQIQGEKDPVTLQTAANAIVYAIFCNSLKNT